MTQLELQNDNSLSFQPLPLKKKHTGALFRSKDFQDFFYDSVIEQTKSFKNFTVYSDRTSALTFSILCSNTCGARRMQAAFEETAQVAALERLHQSGLADPSGAEQFELDPGQRLLTGLELTHQGQTTLLGDKQIHIHSRNMNW